eukprot:GHRR01005738.1.p1 GENE.GHRR01005738.1~~GHRR01005738.1.p1  ORF type:complete len:223 (+),score=30.33 GHRR01005738.1:573-1241(+)
MDEYLRRCSHLARKFSIGHSVANADSWVLGLSVNPGVQEPKGSFKYIEHMHGYKPGGRSLLAELAKWHCANSQANIRAKAILQGMKLMPTMNSDGFAAGTQGNANGVDLNRNFPDPERLCNPSAERWSRPEAATIRCTTGNNSSLEVVAGTYLPLYRFLHEGSVVANYPYNGYAGRSLDAKLVLIGPHGSATQATISCLTPDDTAFRFLAITYVTKHQGMSK